MQRAVQHCYSGQVTASAGMKCVWSGSAQELGESGDRTAEGAGWCAPLLAPYHLAQHFHKTRGPTPKTAGGEAKMSVLKGLQTSR